MPTEKLKFCFASPEFQNDYGQGSSGLFNPISTSSWGPKFGATPTLANGLLTATGQTVDYRAYPTNIIDFFEVGNIFENNVNINSGDAKQNFSFSVGNVDQKGMLPNSSLNRTNLAFKFNSYLTEKFKVGASVDYIISNQLGITQGNGAIRNGKMKGAPQGRNILPPMPWQMYKSMTDDELKAIFAYLKSTKPIKNVVPPPKPPVSASH